MDEPSTPSGLLKEEHRVIGRSLKLLRMVAERVQTGRDLDAQATKELLFFIKEFADHCHHGKEEKVLFPAIEEEGGDLGLQLVETLLADHDQGRAHIAAMMKTVDAYTAGDRGAAKTFASEAVDYVNLMAAHIRAENTTFSDLMDRTFTEEENAELLKHAEEIEESLPVSHQELLEILKNIQAKLETQE